MNFCKKCNYVLNITKKQLNEEEKNHYKIASIEAFLNYIKYNNYTICTEDEEDFFFC